MAENLSDKKISVPDLVNKHWNIEDDNFSIAFVGDMHLHAITPRSRIDSYFETSIQKLAILRRSLKEAGIKYCIILGDVFHVAKERSDYEYAVIQEFQKFRQEGIGVWSIVGNHDLLLDRLDSIEKTSLGILFLTGTVYSFTQILIKRSSGVSIRLTGLNFPNDILPVTKFEEYNILCAHRFYESNLDQNSIMKKDLSKYGYNMYCLGHDHVPYDLEKVPTKDGIVSIVRPGSFMRGTSHNYNTNRLVYYDEVKVGQTIDVVRHTLPVKDPKDVFPLSAIDKVKTDTKDMTRQLADLVTQMYSDDSNRVSVYSVLDSSPIDENVKKRIVLYLESAGIFRKNSKVSNG